MQGCLKTCIYGWQRITKFSLKDQRNIIAMNNASHYRDVRNEQGLDSSHLNSSFNLVITWLVMDGSNCHEWRKHTQGTAS